MFRCADNRIACKVKRTRGNAGQRPSPAPQASAIITGMKHRSAAWRAVGSIPISVAIPTMATDRIPQSRNASVSGVPSNADMVILSNTASLTEDSVRRRFESRTSRARTKVPHCRARLSAAKPWLSEIAPSPSMQRQMPCEHDAHARRPHRGQYSADQRDDLIARLGSGRP